ncbi:MAG: hypothetical protein K2X87_10350 [Gemmataceae bacterium]|nr:hypothetical protein [Gemmataceae bacterium]
MRRANVVAAALLGAAALLFGVALVTKAWLAGDHAGREYERMPRSMSVNMTWPDWFRNMDRDTDHKLSRQEFLGSTGRFKLIDADGDGFITPSEATKADPWFRVLPPEDPPYDIPEGRR